MRLTLICCTYLLLPMAGCATGEWIVGDPVPPGYVQPSTATIDYQVYFLAFDNQWVGRGKEELVTEFGAPQAIYEARPIGTDFEAGIDTLSYVYGVDSGSLASCVDVYVLAQATGTIIKYYCR